MIEQTTDMDFPTISIARQPVFDQNGRLWGYDLFCIGNGDNRGNGSSDTAAYMASGASIHLKQILQGGKKVIVDFTEKNISEQLPYALPPVLTVIKVDEQSCQRQSNMEALNRLKADGYLIAVAGFTGNPAHAPIFGLADIIVIAAQGKESGALRTEIAAAKRYGALLLASRVQDRPLYETCRKLGFSIFSGPFFKYPDTMTARKLSSNEVLRFRLLELIERGDSDINALAAAIQTDVTISFRLLTFLNSAAFAFSQRIKSIHHAISLLGWPKIKNWLRVVLLTDMNQSNDSGELVLLSAQRGMFLELVARDHDFWGFDPESLHLLGLFSLLDALLRLPMAEIIGYLPIEDKMKRALCREAQNEYLPFLQMSQFFEEALWQDADVMVQQLNLDRAKVSIAFQKSIEWARELETLQSAGVSRGEGK
jgi:c-di-GMP phosphodiesterase